MAGRESRTYSLVRFQPVSLSVARDTMPTPKASQLSEIFILLSGLVAPTSGLRRKNTSGR